MLLKPVAAPSAAGAALVVASVDPYVAHVALCAIAGGVGAWTFRASDKLSWRTARYVLAGAGLSGLLTPALAEAKHLTQVSYLLAIAYVGGLAADRLISMIPPLVAGLFQRAANGWVAGVTAAMAPLPPAAPYTPANPRPPTDPQP